MWHSVYMYVVSRDNIATDGPLWCDALNRCTMKASSLVSAVHSLAWLVFVDIIHGCNGELCVRYLTVHSEL